MLNQIPRPGRIIELPRQGTSWDPRLLDALSGRVCQAADLILLAGVAVGIAVLPHLHQSPGTFGDFLQLRVSLRNVLVAAMCIGTWRVILMSVGVYSPARTRSFADYLFRCVIALNSCTAVVGLVAVILRPGRDAWHMVEVFWLVALAMTGALRVVLLWFDRRLLPVVRRGRKDEGV